MFCLFVIVAICHHALAILLESCPVDAEGLCVKIGATASLGSVPKWGPEGRATRMGLEIFAQKWNSVQKLSATGIFVEVHLHDDVGSVASAKEIYGKMADNSSELYVDYFVGPFASSVTREVGKILHPKGRVMVAQVAAAESVYTQGNPRLFGVATTTKHYTGSAVKMLKFKGVTKIAVMSSDNIFADFTTAGLKAHVVEAGIEIVYEHQYKGGGWASATDFSQFPAMAELACSSGAEVFFGIGVYDDATALVGAVNNVTACAPNAFFVNSAPAQMAWVSNNLELSSKFALIGPSQWQEHEHYHDELFGGSEDFSRDLKAMQKIAHDEPPSYIAAAVATAAHVLMRSVLSKTDGTFLPSQDEVAQGLFDLHGLLTFFGPIGFKKCTLAEYQDGETACGSNELKPMITTQVQGGDIKVVAPLAQAEAEFMYPAPVAQQQEIVQVPEDVSASPPWQPWCCCVLGLMAFVHVFCWQLQAHRDFS